MNEVVSVRGLNRSLLKRVKIEATRNGMSLGQWINNAILNKLIEEEKGYIEDIIPVDLTDKAKPTKINDVWEVPRGSVKIGTDYSINGRVICAAGTKGPKEVVTSREPSLLHENGYEIFWIR